MVATSDASPTPRKSRSNVQFFLEIIIQLYNEYDEGGTDAKNVMRKETLVLTKYFVYRINIQLLNKYEGGTDAKMNSALQIESLCGNKNRNG